jgi:hypothetical protein
MPLDRVKGLEKPYSCALWAMRMSQLYNDVALEIAREPHPKPDLDKLREVLDRVGEYCEIDVSPAKGGIDWVERSLEEVEHPKPRGIVLQFPPHWVSGWERMASIAHLVRSMNNVVVALEEKAKREGGVSPFEL